MVALPVAARAEAWRLGLSLLCLGCARALHRLEIKVEQRLLFVAFVLSCLRRTKNFLWHFAVETLSSGRQNFLLSFIPPLDLFIDDGR